MKVICIRTAIIGGGLSYDCLVKKDEMPHPELDRGMTTLRSNRNKPGSGFTEYVYFDKATQPKKQLEMSPGLDRWNLWQKHEKEAKAEMLKILQSVFPETKQLQELPLLWVNGLMHKETSKEITTEYAGKLA